MGIVGELQVHSLTGMELERFNTEVTGQVNARLSVIMGGAHMQLVLQSRELFPPQVWCMRGNQLPQAAFLYFR